MGKRVKLKAGDVFTIPLGDGTCGLGQVIEPSPYLYIVVFRDPVSSSVSLDDIRTDDILLCGRTMDALFFHGRWHVIANLPVAESWVPRPCTKVEYAGERWVSDFHGKRLIRPATEREWERLDFHTATAPIAYENALKAFHGLAPAEERYRTLDIDHVRTQAEICSA